LWIDPNDMNELHLSGKSLHGPKGQDYIAVSYSWKHTPILKSSEAGRYRIIGTEGQIVRQSKVRDEALSRVIHYALRHEVFSFWIDQECTPQG